MEETGLRKDNRPTRLKFEKCGCNYCTGRKSKVKQGQIDGRKKRK